ncbi:hypothetical protein SAMN02927924_02791 [Sphingobium faniae]|nr:hypothetical protein SAMN02927924_02791 [Sphingobium faniae]
MNDEANLIIDGLGGTTKVSRLTHVPTSTVHSWRKNGIPPARLAHLKLAAKAEGLAWPLDNQEECQSSPGKIGDFAASESEAA